MKIIKIAVNILLISVIFFFLRMTFRNYFYKNVDLWISELKSVTDVQVGWGEGCSVAFVGQLFNGPFWGHNLLKFVAPSTNY